METLYRKYRPRKFSELVGQEHVKRILTRALEEGKVSHAYIFAGPRGTGKTTTARILAKALNCENRKGAEPCGQCYACKAIDEGTFMDVIELDAASNRGIDEIRRIKEGASFRPIEGKYKVYIIDEVHMLTKEAFNALLKTLEEPPEHVVFILATTNIEKVPPTIVSRCQVLEFRNLPENLIADRLKFVAEKEGIDISEDAIEFIAKRSMGGMRDALTILEQVWKFSGGKRIEVQDVENALGLIRSDVVKKYVDAILGGDLNGVKRIVDEVYYSGKELDVLVQEAVDLAVERVTENPAYVQLSRELLNILREIKMFENKRVYLVAASLSLAQRFQRRETTPTRTVEVKKEKAAEEEVRETKAEEVEEERVESVKEKEEPRTQEAEAKPQESDELEKIMEYLKEEGDLALYVALSLAEKVKVEGDKLVVEFPKEKELSAQTIKDRILEMEDSIRKAIGRNLSVEVKIMGKSEKAEAVKAKMLSLFGKEG